jgi:transcriptional regulator with XRE-family HTH domain
MRPIDIVRSPAANSVIELRSKLGETQQQFALRLGSSMGSVARYETNRDPTRRVLGRMYLAAIESGQCGLIETFWDLLCADVGFPSGTARAFPTRILQGRATNRRSGTPAERRITILRRQGRRNSHCCPKHGEVVPRFVESRGLESAGTGISDEVSCFSLIAACPKSRQPEGKLV